MLSWYETVSGLIDLRSFSNLWYWIMLAVVWSSASHFVLGVPWDMVLRARRQGGAAEEDLHDLVRVNVNRLLHIAETAGAGLLAIACFVLTMLTLLGFVYGIEFAQAVDLLAVPLTIVVWLSIRCARGIREADGADLYRRLHRHRLVTQGIGMAAIFVSAFWGMAYNLGLHPF
ncbi:component of SufBCD complex [Tropicimonas sp. IMCC34011]|uniref:component of SufBCD complex n=1 Tax=Tropicimonas sp. IMCC34011 TaxID=2248759 RepID=UPI000E2302B8|nr:component of SufBCD complex [Tropicimonas sp. IMCC34011]